VYEGTVKVTDVDIPGIVPTLDWNILGITIKELIMFLSKVWDKQGEFV
jgi:hypothetical protein